MRRNIVTGALVVALAVLVWLATTSGNPSAPYFSVADVVRNRPAGEVTVAGRVVSSSGPASTFRVVIADEDDPGAPTLDLLYAGAQRLSFGPGVTVIAHGTLRDDGVFVVSEFVTKSPSVGDKVGGSAG